MNPEYRSTKSGRTKAVTGSRSTRHVRARAGRRLQLEGLENRLLLDGTDLIMTGARTNGLTRLVVEYEVQSAVIGSPFEIGFYRSADPTFDAGDTRLDSLPVSDPDEWSVGRHWLILTAGAGPGEIALPGAGAPESDDDYFLLVVADHLNVLDEMDADPFNEDNTGTLSGPYHVPGGPIFYHGREPRPGLLVGNEFGDVLTVTAAGSDLEFVNAGPAGGSVTYAVADVTGLRARLHAGNDRAVGTALADLILGGNGADSIDGAGGNDMLGGGSGHDSITGGPGSDDIFDGPGDDLVDTGTGDNTVMATPGSDDVFIDGGGKDTLDFSQASQGITLDLDSTATQRVDAGDNTAQVNGQWENFIGSQLPDVVTVKPLVAPFLRRIDGSDGPGDRLIFDGLGLAVTFDGTKFMVPGFGDVTVSGFESIQTINASPRIIDNSDTGYSEVGTWIASDPMFPQGFNGGVRFNAAGTGNDVATWRFMNVAPGQYFVSTTWTFAGDRAKNSPFTIRDGGPTGPVVSMLQVNQEQNPAEFDPPEDGQNILFRNLAVVDVTDHEVTVQLTDNADQFVAADAVRIVPVGNADLLPPIFVDDGDAGFATIGCSPTTGTGAFGDQHVCDAAGETATWDTSVLSTIGGRDTTFDVSVTWRANAANTTAAQFRVSTGAGTSFTTTVNQQQPPGDFTEGGIPWKVLGQVTVPPAGDDITVELLRELAAIQSHIADAVLFVPACRMTIHDRGVKDNVVFAGSILTLPTGSPDRRVIGKITVENTGSAPCSLGQVTVSGAGFSLSSGVGATTLPPFAFTSFEYAFQSSMTGTFDGMVSIPNSAPGQNPFNFNLRANVVQDTAPPMVNIVSPPDGGAVIEGTTLPVEVEAMDDVGVNRVEFRVDGQVVATDMTAPFETAIQVPMGVTQITLEARAVDFGGNTGDSAPVVIIVEPDQPPTVEIITPPDGSGVVEGQTIQIEVEATDDVRVDRVEFLVNGQIVQTETEEPFVAQFVVPAGVNPIILQARAMDAGGQVASAFSNLTVFETPIMTNTSIVVGPDAGVESRVHVFDGQTLAERFRLFPYGPNFHGGVRVATGDVTGDDAPDIITGAGSGAPGGHVKVFSGINGAELRSFLSFPGFTGGVTVASGDVNSDGFADVIVGAGPGAAGGQVKVFSGQTAAEICSFFAFPGFTGGVTVAGGDINSDGFDDIIVGAGPGAPDGHVKVFNGQTAAEIHSFFAFPMFIGGVTVASGDLNSDGFDDVIVGAGPSAPGGHVKVFSGQTAPEIQSFFAFPGFTGGVNVAVADVNGDGKGDLVVGAGPDTDSQVKVFNGTTQALLDSFFAYDAGFTAGVFVAGVRPESIEPGGGNVTARVSRGKLTVRGDMEPNNIRIEPGNAGANSLLITGMNGTRINGGTVPVPFTRVTKGINVDTLGGDDTVNFDGSRNPLRLRGNVVVNTGTGDDALRVTRTNFFGNANLDTSIGGDEAKIVDAVFEKPFSLTLGPGSLNRPGRGTFDDDDRLTLVGSRFMGQATVNTGLDADILDIDNSVFNFLLLMYTGAGNDTVRIERGSDNAGLPSVFVSPVLLFTQEGDDRVEIGRAGQPGNSAQFFGGFIFDGAIGVDVLDAGILSQPNANGNLFARPPVLRGVENRLHEGRIAAAY